MCSADQESINIEHKEACSHSTSYCAMISICIALVFFLWYYFPHSNVFSLRYYFGASLIASILVGLASFIIGFITLGFVKFKYYLLYKNNLQSIEFKPRRFNPESMEEKIHNSQPLSNDQYYDFWKH